MGEGEGGWGAAALNGEEREWVYHNRVVDDDEASWIWDIEMGRLSAAGESWARRSKQRGGITKRPGAHRLYQNIRGLSRKN